MMTSLAEVFYYVNYVNVNYWVKNSTVDCKYLLYFLWGSRWTISYSCIFCFNLKKKTCRKSKYLQQAILNRIIDVYIIDVVENLGFYNQYKCQISTTIFKTNDVHAQRSHVRHVLYFIKACEVHYIWDVWMILCTRLDRNLY